MVDEDRLGRRGDLGRAELELTVMAQDDVLQHEERRARKILARTADPRRERSQQDEPLHGVPEQVAFGGVGEALLPRELHGLPEVVQEETCQHDVAVEIRIERQDRVGDLQELQRVLEQPADERVVQRRRRGSATEPFHQRLVAEELPHQRPHARMRERSQDRLQLREHLVEIA